MLRNINDEIKNLLETYPIILFMKGTCERPECGFSNLVCQVLGKLSVQYHTVNILQDLEMRQGIKDYTRWPTIPQLYINNEFIGGADIVKDMYQSGELDALITKHGLKTV